MPIPLGILAVAGAGTAGGASSFDLLETTVLGSSASSVTFSNLDTYTEYKHLQIRMSVLSSSGFAVGYLRFNGVSSANNYAHHRLYGDGSNVVSTTGGTNDNKIELFYYSATANMFSASVVDILDFSSSNKNTTVRELHYWDGNTSRQVTLWSGTTLFTNAVTSIEISGSSNFAASSRFSLYGIK